MYILQSIDMLQLLKNWHIWAIQITILIATIIHCYDYLWDLLKSKKPKE
jgi:hypothetical protein